MIDYKQCNNCGEWIEEILFMGESDNSLDDGFYCPNCCWLTSELKRSPKKEWRW